MAGLHLKATSYPVSYGLGGRENIKFVCQNQTNHRPSCPWRGAGRPVAINFCKKVGLTPDRPARTGVVTAENRHPKALDSHLLVQMIGRERLSLFCQNPLTTGRYARRSGTCKHKYHASMTQTAHQHRCHVPTTGGPDDQPIVRHTSNHHSHLPPLQQHRHIQTNGEAKSR